MKTKFLKRVLWLMIPLLTMLTVSVSQANAALRSDWELVTTTAQLTSGGTFIISYNSGSPASNFTVVPMRNETNATTSGNGYMYSGTTAGSTGTGTIDMANSNVDTSPYEVTIEAGASSGQIAIKLTSGTQSGKYIKFSGTSNHNLRVSTTVNNDASFTPTYSSSCWQLLCAGRANRYLRYWTNSNYRFTNAANNSGGAQWLTIYKKVAASTFTVTYNANNATSGSVPTDATAYNSGATVTVKGNTGNLARTGYAFGGWNTQADGNGTNYAAGSGTFTITANTTLYAKWIPTYTVTYNGNGNNSGSVPVDGSSPYNSGTTVTVLGNTGSLAKTGWTFAGWNTNATGTGTDRAAGSTFTISANTTLYAKWTCTVTWSVNGATNVYSAQTITYNSSGSKVNSVPTPDPASYCGQVFAGWTTEEYSGNSAPGVLFKTVGDSPNLNSTGSITFYAVFADYAD